MTIRSPLSTCSERPGILPLEAAPPSQSTCTPVVPCADPRSFPDLVVGQNAMLQAVSLDVRGLAPDSCAVLEGEVGGSGLRRLLLFTSNTPNLSPGDRVIGDPADHPDWFDVETCHGDPHFKELTYHKKTYLANLGISVCWADEYRSCLDAQPIDITGVPAGSYVLEEEVNAERFLREAVYTNNSVAVAATIP